MKKILVIVAATLFGISANAQWFVGGSLSLNYDSTNYDSVTPVKTSTFTVNIAPQIGYNINEKLAVGASLNITPGYNISSESFYDPGSDEPHVTTNKFTNFNWSINPFVRYCIWSINKFGICAQGGIGIGTRSVILGDRSTTTFNVSVSALPVLTYSLNEKFTLLAYISAAQLSFNGNYGNGTSNTQFGFNAATQGQLLAVGFQYNF